MRLARAIRRCARRSSHFSQRTTGALKRAYQEGGAKGFWQEYLELTKEAGKRVYISPARMAAAYARTGDTEHAFEWLEKAYNERDQLLFYNLKGDADFDSLRSDPRFANLMQRIGLAQ
ncbi:MAG: hypothetical protein WAU45_02175 [Blastocatellia bacterium]